MPNEQIAVSVVIPAYNEEEAAQPVLKDIKSVMDGLGLPYEIIVVDDGSTDSTVAQCQAIEGVQVIRHSRNRGTGAARTTGMQAARGQKVLMTDADGTYPTDVFAQMIEALDSCEMVIGARKREAGTIRWLRSLAKNLIKSLASYMTATKIPDLNSGLRGMKRDAVLRFLSILPNTHSWVSTITMAFLSSNLEVRWIEIDYHKRIGKSTFHPIRDTYNYLTLVVRAIMYFNPLRIFLPLSLGLFTVGFVKAITDIFRYNFHFAPSTVMLVLTAVQLGAIGLLADLIVKRSKL
jgi:glycosyltransferase involved in cell wall biosynthesis